MKEGEGWGWWHGVQGQPWGWRVGKVGSGGNSGGLNDRDVLLTQYVNQLAAFRPFSPGQLQLFGVLVSP